MQASMILYLSHSLCLQNHVDGEISYSSLRSNRAPFQHGGISV